MRPMTLGYLGINNSQRPLPVSLLADAHALSSHIWSIYYLADFSTA